MAARTATPAGKKLYKRRAGLVEPAFAQLFARFGRYLSYRGHDAADAEIKLLGAVHNLAKLFEHRRRHPAPAPPPPRPPPPPPRPPRPPPNTTPPPPA